MVRLTRSAKNEAIFFFLSVTCYFVVFSLVEFLLLDALDKFRRLIVALSVSSLFFVTMLQFLLQT